MRVGYSKCERFCSLQEHVFAHVCKILQHENILAPTSVANTRASLTSEHTRAMPAAIFTHAGVRRAEGDVAL